MPTERGTKTSQKTAHLRTPKTGIGKLRTGGKPGNKGGTGRPPDAIRATLRLNFDSRIKVWTAIADDESKDDNLRIKAVEMLAKYGMGTTITPTNTAGGDLPTSIPVELV